MLSKILRIVLYLTKAVFLFSDYANIMAIAGYKPRAYVLCMQPTEGKLFISDGLQRQSIEERNPNMPIFIPSKPVHWNSPQWKTDTCPGNFIL